MNSLSRWCKTVLVGVLILISIGPVGALFEDRLTCVISDDGVIVSLDSQYRLCQSYLDDIDVLLLEVIESRETVGDYIAAGRNIEYRQPLALQYDQKKSQLEQFRRQIVQAMDTYEYRIFTQIKPRVLAIVDREARSCRAVRSTLSDVHPRE